MTKEMKKQSTVNDILKKYVINDLYILNLLLCPIIVYDSMEHHVFMWTLDLLDGSWELYLLLYVLLIGFSLVVIGVRWMFENNVLGASSPEMTLEESQLIIKGMLKNGSQIDVNELSEITGRPVSFWTGRIYAIIGGDTVSGDFDGKVFTLSDKEDIANAIDELFAEYEEFETKIIGNIE